MTQYSSRWRSAFLIACAGSLAVNANAAPGDCVTIAAPLHKTGGYKPYKVNSASVSGSGWIAAQVGVDGFVTAAIAAADQWNDNSHGATFRWTGYTSSLDLPDLKTDCDALGITHSIIKVFPDAAGGVNPLAGVIGRCRDTSNRATQFVLTVYGLTCPGGVCQNYQHVVGDLAAYMGYPGGVFDLVGVLTHEFGHVLNLGHTGSAEYAVMNAGVLPNNSYNRDLYQWDAKCVDQLAGFRNLREYHYPITSAGIGTLTGVSAAAPIGNVGPVWSSSLGMRIQARMTTCQAKSDGLAAGSLVSCILGFDSVIGAHASNITRTASPLVFGWPDYAERLFVPDWQEDVPYSILTSHRKVRQYKSINGFATVTASYLNVCTNPTFSCPSTAVPLAATEEVGFAQETVTGQTVIAFAQQWRAAENDPSKRALRIAVGMANDSTLYYPGSSSGEKTSVGPAVACKPTTNECLVAFVREQQPTFRVAVKAFTVNPSTLQASYGATTQLPSTVRSAARLALFYTNGQWFLALRSAYQQGQYLEIYSSTNGTTWTNVSPTPLLYTAVGPAVLGWRSGTTNALTIAY